MQQEDDLRALAKIMEFGRAVSIFLLVVHVYVYCYPSITAWHLNLEVIDRILVNFNNTTGIFNCILWSKLLAVLLLAVSCLGTHGVKGEKITWPKIYAVLVAGCALFFLNWWLLKLPLPHMANTAFYIFTLTAPVAQWLRQKRAEQVLKLLRTTHLPLSEIAEQCGFEIGRASCRERV